MPTPHVPRPNSVCVKALAFDEAVNVTLGLPIIRTSVDHGTALDIAWQEGECKQLESGGPFGGTIKTAQLPDSFYPSFVCLRSLSFAHLNGPSKRSSLAAGSSIKGRGGGGGPQRGILQKGELTFLADFPELTDLSLEKTSASDQDMPSSQSCPKAVAQPLPHEVGNEGARHLSRSKSLHCSLPVKRK